MIKPLILFIDAYDSFSNNIISLIETTLDVSVRTVRIDDPILSTSDQALRQELRNYVAVVCGPGPGNPENEKDVGLMRQIWRLEEVDVVPTLGICLGFQSLCLEFGGKIQRLKGPQHGMIRRVTHVGEVNNEETIFRGVGKIYATLYQSLCADIGHAQLQPQQWEVEKWNCTSQCPDLLPLAWVEHDHSLTNDSGIQDEKVLVAIQHTKRPYWALQYHPESICTNDESQKLIKNWFRHASAWNVRFRERKTVDLSSLIGSSAIKESIMSLAGQVDPCTDFIKNHNSDGIEPPKKCVTKTIQLPTGMTVPDIVECVQNPSAENIVLESSNAHDSSPVKARFSIIGIEIEKCTRIEYFVGRQYMNLIVPSNTNSDPQVRKYERQSFGGIWTYIASQLAKVKAVSGNDESPFWGGFMGYTTYELGLESIQVSRHTEDEKQETKPDLSFAWVTSSIIVDHFKGLLYLQQLVHDFESELGEARNEQISLKIEAWLSKNKDLQVSSFPVDNAPKIQRQNDSMASNTNRQPFNDPIKGTIKSIKLPQPSIYKSKVLACQNHIREGSSYEICLTDQTILGLEGPNSSWRIYKTLRYRQPAPFASYIRLGTATFISASPEQFLKWDEYGKCELRPMKGTVKKSEAVKSLSQATALLDVPKEKAENLMIVDLVRHDLHGVCGAGQVSVPRLMVVEEYTSVFQMISVVQGQIPQAAVATGMPMANDNKVDNPPARYTGLDVLAASLPPGSMTGAPKKRSCEILQQIEGQNRSLYSGVVGYIDVRGRGDWSVNIRCLFRWDDDIQTSESGQLTEIYRVGAGGAVTALSTTEGEMEEMLTKLNTTLGIFKEFKPDL
ncbi:Para-aminobenzoate (PABA) synthase/ABZ1 [Blumeria hordei DH14]|uniref:aminodeoxychorismate synthase n=1 Tax=Blumeria graminis f. sp. hordei (strain DH14) TaxID=546991 RepID=N1JDI1_BLUG1|nr:Para-aminobenzoate (PABA) synthase/ABZ1 [Blumeria hordei DH14]